jgi:hypothetical protein
VWYPVFSPACSNPKDLHPRPWVGIQLLNHGGETLTLGRVPVNPSRFPQRHPRRVPRESRGGVLLRGMHLRVRFGAICSICMPLNNKTIVVTSIPLFGEDKHYYYPFMYPSNHLSIKPSILPFIYILIQPFNIHQ